MLELVTTTQFRKDLKRLRKRGADMKKLDDVLQTLCAEEPLSEKHRDHALVGDYIGFRECNVAPDWLPAQVHTLISSSRFFLSWLLFFSASPMNFLVTTNESDMRLLSSCVPPSPSGLM